MSKVRKKRENRNVGRYEKGIRPMMYKRKAIPSVLIELVYLESWLTDAVLSTSI